MRLKTRARSRISLLNTILSGHLRPSRELLEYYRKKIGEFEDEHEKLVSKLDEYKMTYEEQVCDHMSFENVFSFSFATQTSSICCGQCSVHNLGKELLLFIGL